MRTVASRTAATPVVEPGDTVQYASEAMLQERAGAVIVAAEGRVIGLLTAADVAEALAGHDTRETPVAEIARGGVPILEAGEALAEARLQMRSQGQRLAIVMDPDGQPLGLLEDPEAAPETA